LLSKIASDLNADPAIETIANKILKVQQEFLRYPANAFLLSDITRHLTLQKI
jgi:hypothetical protein